VQLPADGIIRHPHSALAGEVFAQQGHRPVGGVVVPRLRRILQGGQENVLQVLGQQARARPAAVVAQCLGVAVVPVGVEPVVDAAPADPQEPGDLGDGLAVGDLEQRQRSLVQAGV
jgi:hypothetical protein